MIEFLKSYGVWIVVVLMLGIHLVPMFRRGRGMGCGMGGHQHDGAQSPGEEKKEEQHKHYGWCLVVQYFIGSCRSHDKGFETK